jgi:hypothetical protein
MNEKWEASKWVFWGIIMVLVITAIGYVVMPISKKVERKVFIESHQYKESMVDRSATLQAAIAEINSRLAGNIDEQTRADLEAQKAAINIQLNSMRR